MSNNIDPELDKIKHGTFGIDIRDAIHDAIEKLWLLAESKEPGGGGVAGAAVTVFNGGICEVTGGDTYEQEFPETLNDHLINGVRYSDTSEAGGTLIFGESSTRCTIDNPVFVLPAGKKLTISCGTSNIQIGGWETDRSLTTIEITNWQAFPLVIDNSSGASERYFTLNFRKSDDSSITPQDIGTVTTTIE